MKTASIKNSKEEYPIGNGETVDLMVMGESKKVAIEIETGKSDAIRNIGKCLDAGYAVMSLAISKNTSFSVIHIAIS